MFSACTQPTNNLDTNTARTFYGILFVLVYVARKKNKSGTVMMKGETDE
jgi:hypothetical protein